VATGEQTTGGKTMKEMEYQEAVSAHKAFPLPTLGVLIMSDEVWGLDEGAFAGPVVVIFNAKAQAGR